MSSTGSSTGLRGALRRMAAAIGLGRRAPGPTPTAPSRPVPAPPAHRGLPDYRGVPVMEYAPHPDGRGAPVADPGEIVWTWVPFEEDPSRGKDRPVLVIGRAGDAVLALMLTSKDHVQGGDVHTRHGDWLDIGTGPWDPRRRPSEVRLDRVLQIDPHAIRREGCVVDRDLFDAVAQALKAISPTRHTW